MDNLSTLEFQAVAEEHSSYVAAAAVVAAAANLQACLPAEDRTSLGRTF